MEARSSLFFFWDQWFRLFNIWSPHCCHSTWLYNVCTCKLEGHGKVALRRKTLQMQVNPFLICTCVCLYWQTEHHVPNTWLLFNHLIIAYPSVQRYHRLQAVTQTLLSPATTVMRIYRQFLTELWYPVNITWPHIAQLPIHTGLLVTYFVQRCRLLRHARKVEWSANQTSPYLWALFQVIRRLPFKAVIVCTRMRLLRI